MGTRIRIDGCIFERASVFEEKEGLRPRIRLKLTLLGGNHLIEKMNEGPKSELLADDADSDSQDSDTRLQ